MENIVSIAGTSGEIRVFSPTITGTVNRLVDRLPGGETQMFALFVFVVFTATALAAAVVLADSGLRWWSAFGQLRHRLADSYVPRSDFGLRSRIGEPGFAGFSRNRVVMPPVVRRAA